MSNYFKDAFRELEMLDEDVFSFDKDGVASLQDFLSGDVSKEPEVVIDSDAMSEEELKDSYEGKVILSCSVCHNLHYKDPEDVHFEEGADCVDVDEECPVCLATMGYKIVGQVAPYEPHTEEDNNEVLEPVEESEKSLTEETDLYSKLEKVLTEDTDKESEKSKGRKGRSREESTYFYVAQGMLDGGFFVHHLSDKTGKVTTKGVKQLYDPTDIGVDDDGIFVWVKDEADAKPAQGVADKLGLETHLDEPKKYVRGKNRKFHLYIPQDKWDKDVPEHIFNESMNESAGTTYDEVLKVLDDNGYDVQDKDVIAYAEAAAEYIEMANAATDGRYSVSKWFKNTQQNYPEDLKELKRLEETCEKQAMTECVNNVEVEANGQKVEVKSEEDKTVVEVSTEKKEDEEAETIVPVDEETKKEIEEPEVDIDNISFDENELSELGESYLKKVYENVDSFKVSSIKSEDKKLLVEGVITFNSGKKSNTKFVFEDIRRKKNGCIKFIGENLQISKNKSAFAFTVSLDGNKGIFESFNYNYLGKDSKSGKSVPLYGKVKKRA